MIFVNHVQKEYLYYYILIILLIVEFYVRKQLIVKDWLWFKIRLGLDWVCMRLDVINNDFYIYFIEFLIYLLFLLFFINIYFTKTVKETVLYY